MTIPMTKNQAATVSNSYPWKFTNNTNKELIITLLIDKLSGGTGKGSENFDKTQVQLIPKEYSNGKVPAGKTATYTLDWTFNASSTESFPCGLYPLNAVTSDRFIPVWTKAITKNFDNSPPSFDDVTVEQVALTSFNECMTFIQQYEAYPKSNFAKNFNAALTDANAPSTASGGTASSANAAATDPVDTFFKNSSGAKDVTHETYLTLNAYFSEYPFPWASDSSKTYYLYSSTQQSGSNVASFVGAVAITKPSSFSYSEAYAGYTMVFGKAAKPDYLNPKNTGGDQDNYTTSSSTTLGYETGQFVDNPSQDVHDICVQGVYVLQSTLTGQNASGSAMGTIVPIVVGTVNGLSVIGYPNPVKGTYEDSKPGSSDPFLYNLIHPKGVGGVIQSIMEFGGMIMMLDFAWGKLKGRLKKNKEATEEAKAKAEKDGGDPKTADAKYTEADLEAAKTKAQADAKAEFEAKAKSEGISSDAQAKISDAVDEAQGTGADVGDATAADAAVGGTVDAAEAAGKYGDVVEKCKTSADSISDAATKCEIAVEEGSSVAAEQLGKLEGAANEVGTTFDKATTAVEKIESDGSVGDAGSAIGKDMTTAVDDVSTTVETVDTTLGDVHSALESDPISNEAGVPEAVEDAATLNEEVSTTIADQAAAADSTSAVNEGKESPAEGDGLPFED